MTAKATSKPLVPKVEAALAIDAVAVDAPPRDHQMNGLASGLSNGLDPLLAVVLTLLSGDDERLSDNKSDELMKRLLKLGLPKKYFCKSCKQGFTRKHNMILHELIHLTVKPHQCLVCLLKFRRIHDLKRHEKLHTGEKPHVCKRCNKKFTRNDALARHQNLPNACIPVRDRDSPDDSSSGSGSGNGSSSADSNNTRALLQRPLALLELLLENLAKVTAAAAEAAPTATPLKSELVDTQLTPQALLPQPQLLARPSKLHFTLSFDKPDFKSDFTALPLAPAVPASHLQQLNHEYLNYNRINDLPQPKRVLLMVFPNNPYLQFVPQMLHNPPTAQNGHQSQLVPLMVLDNNAANGTANGSVPPPPNPPASTVAATSSGALALTTSPDAAGAPPLLLPTKTYAEVSLDTGKYVPLEKYQDLLKYVKKMETEVRTQRERIQELERLANEQKIIVRYLEDREHDLRRTHDNHKKHTKSSDLDDLMEKPALKRRGLDDDDEETSE